MHPKAKPIVLFNDERLSPEEKIVVDNAIELFIHGIGLTGIMDSENWGNWNINEKPHNSLMWYLAKAYQPFLRKRQLNAATMLRDLQNSPHQIHFPHYPLIITEFDIYHEDFDEKVIRGVAIEEVGAVISTFRTRATSDPAKNSFILLAVIIHELGHVFGMCNVKRDPRRIILAGGPHCTNVCVMRQVLKPGHDILHMQDLMGSDDKPFCDDCLEDLFLFFA